jgi:salicylate hydroxylase
VQLSANGIRVLHELGVHEALRALACEASGKEVRLWNSGQTWKLFDLGAESVARYGYPYLMFHRADLQEVLSRAVRAIKPDAIHLGARCVAAEPDGTGCTLRIESGERVRGDALVGADGVHSAIRRSLFGTDAPRFLGIMAWRGIVDVASLPAGLLRPVGTNWVGPGGHIVHYFLRRGELLNFAGFVERDDWKIESWSAEGTKEECLRDFAGWHETVHTLIRHFRTPFKWALAGREPMAQWTTGRATLLGDACHPMVPFLAQGAVMALEDGCVLARCVAAYDDVAAALQAYEAVRRERTARTVRGSMENAGRFHNMLLSDSAQAEKYVNEQWDPDLIRARYEWLFTYDATSVSV